MPQKKPNKELHKSAHDQAKFLKRINFYEELLKNSNVLAYLLTIRQSEGVLRPDGFNLIVGYSRFKDTSHHPNILVRDLNSSAAGGYQINYSTWGTIVNNLVP